MRGSLEFWIFGFTFAIAIFELILLGTWNPLYFRVGIPIFRRTYSSIPSGYGKPTPKELEDSMTSMLSNSVGFKEFGPDEYAFRDKMLEFKLFAGTPVMHGLLQWNSSSANIRITGYANLFPLLMMFGFIFIFFKEPTAWVLLILIFGSLYAMNCWRFNKVGRIASEKWQKAIRRSPAAG